MKTIYIFSKDRRSLKQLWNNEANNLKLDIASLDRTSWGKDYYETVHSLFKQHKRLLVITEAKTHKEAILHAIGKKFITLEQAETILKQTDKFDAFRTLERIQKREKSFRL